MSSFSQFEPALSRLQIVREGRDAIVACLDRERQRASQLDASRAYRLIAQVGSGASVVIFGGVSYQVEGP